MTALLLAAEEVAKIRALKGLAYTLAVMLRLDKEYPGRAFRPEEVALIAGLDARTVAGQLKNLAVLDRVILSGSGYVLTQGGRALFLEMNQGDNEALDQAPDSKALALPKTSTVDDSGTKPLHPNTHNVCALEEVEESESLILKTDSPSTSVVNRGGDDTKIVQLPSVEKILAATPIIFGDPGVLSARLDLSLIEPRTALGWVAQAFDQKQHLRAPAGLVHTRLSEFERPKPQSKYLYNPLNFLPDEYLEVIGLKDYPCECGKIFQRKADFKKHQEMMLICGQCGERFHDQNHLDDHIEKQHERQETIIEPDDSATEYFDGRMSAHQAWEDVKGLLQTEMPKASFDTWVRDTECVRYDRNASVITIGVCNTYTRDWLESRLASTVVRILVGVLNQQVAVEFVVAEIGEEE